MSYPNAIKNYQQHSARGAVEGASPHRLIQMLLDGAMERIFIAKRALADKETARKGESISAAIAIIDGLRASLDLEKGGDIAANLKSLYDYMERRLLEANLKNDAGILDEVASLLADIGEAWRGIAPSTAPAAGSEDDAPRRSFSYGV